ncbi:hypothetical protein LCGC14_0942290 [marine sediment metagenome]|uniref:Uncharacterized protein n=1 Tax=marine sediment metagenome TaxID=412755 RepID=A0A0F9NJU2_9ZZZZ
MQEPDRVREELAYGLGCQLEALRLEIRAASRRRHDDPGDALHYERRADSMAEKGHMALTHPRIEPAPRRGASHLDQLRAQPEGGG